VDQADYDVWPINFGTSLDPGIDGALSSESLSVIVPELSSLALLVLTFVAPPL
jgi:hypothetical protein